MKNLASIRGFKNASIGTIMSWTGTTGDLPKGWLACDGTTYNDADYPALVAIIGYTYGGSSGSSTFVLPNLNGQNRVPVHDIIVPIEAFLNPLIDAKFFIIVQLVSNQFQL